MARVRLFAVTGGVLLLLASPWLIWRAMPATSSKVQVTLPKDDGLTYVGAGNQPIQESRYAIRGELFRPPLDLPPRQSRWPKLSPEAAVEALLAAGQTRNIDEILSLYDQESADAYRDKLKSGEMHDRFLNQLAHIRTVRLVLLTDNEDGIIAWADHEFDTGEHAVIPIFMKKTFSGYRMTAGTIAHPETQNLALALTRHPLGELVSP
jgi:hypothetical protein